MQPGIAQNLKPSAYTEIIFNVSLSLVKRVNHDNGAQSLGLLTTHQEIFCSYLKLTLSDGYD